MDELALLKDMADDTPLASAGQLAPARARLMAAMAVRADIVGADAMGGETAAGVAVAASSASVATMPRRRRLAIFGVATVGLAAAITAVVALGPFEQVGIAPQQASAEQVLLDAAAAAEGQPDAVPRPDQFVYTRREMPAGAWETWYSVDGSRAGQYRMFDGVAHEVSPCDAGGCTMPPAYDPDLPTDAAGMRAYLTNKADNNGRDNDNNAGNAGNAGNDRLYLGRAMDLLETMYVRPASRAALFEVLAGADGFTVVDHAVDGAGRSGVGVRLAPDAGLILTTDGGDPILVFDKDTHAYLGMAGGDGTDGRDAVVRQAIVDEVGQTE